MMTPVTCVGLMLVSESDSSTLAKCGRCATVRRFLVGGVNRQGLLLENG